jgi:mycofactocin system creatininase family protein
MQLAELSTVDVGRRAAAGAVLAIPLGSTEQHGPHLPLSTDTDIAVTLCSRLARARSDVLVAPAVPYGSSGEHAGFSGTLSIGQAALELVVVELVRSATDTFDHVVLVSAHGGNNEAVTRAVTILRAESRDVLLHQPCWSGDAHAGRPETSMQLALDSSRVRMDLARPGDLRALTETWSLLRTGGVRAVSPNGVLGDPTDASLAEGQRLLDELTDALVRDVSVWHPQRSGVSA